MNNLSILIIDNDINKTLEFEWFIERIGYQVLDIVNTTTDAFNVLQQQRTDLVLISTTDQSTIKDTRPIQNLNIPILYITNSLQNKEEGAIPANDGVYFLNRPLQRSRLRAAIELVIKHTQTNQMLSQTKSAFATAHDMYVKKRGVYYRILLQDIVFIQAANNYVLIQTEEEQFMTQTRLSDMEELVKGQSFLKVHRSYLVNLKKTLIVNFKKNTIKVAEYDIPISRSARSLLMKKIK